jgi:TctA family transporter
MDTFGLLAQGLLAAMQWHNLLYALIGVTLGTAVASARPLASCPASARRSPWRCSCR